MTLRILRCGLLAIATGLFGTATLASPIDWKTVRGWDISFYPASDGCQAFALFEEDTAFFIGFDNSDGDLLLDVTLLDKKWASIEKGTEYDIAVKFGNESPWSLEMDGLRTDDFPGLNIVIDAQSDEAKLFIREFQGESSMTWSYADTTLGRYTLKGSRAAFEEVMNCQRSYLAARNSQSDPFAKSNKKADPFAD